MDLHDLKQSIPEWICHYILYDKDAMVLEDLKLLSKTNKHDKRIYRLFSMPDIVAQSNDHSKNRH